MRLGIVGTGSIARIHAQAARNTPGVTLAAVVNHRPESMATFATTFDIPRQFTTLESMLAAGGCDAVAICTPNYLHAPQSIACLDRGVHVMVEKPMAMNAPEAETMIRASERSGARLMVAHCWRFDAEVRWLQAQLQAGQIGSVVRTHGYGVHVDWGPSGWFAQKRLAGGGALADMGIHAIDTARFLIGDPQPESVFARISTQYGAYDVDDTGVIVVNWANGVTSVIESGWWQPFGGGPEAGTRLWGKRGTGGLFPTQVRVRDLNAGADQHDQVVDPGFPAVRDPHCPQSMYDAQMAYFEACVSQGTPPSPGGAEGLVNMRIVDAAYESSRTGKVVPC
jgi:predicted dehydrogenase